MKNDLYFDISIEHGIKWERLNWYVSQLLSVIGITGSGFYILLELNLIA